MQILSAAPSLVIGSVAFVLLLRDVRVVNWFEFSSGVSAQPIVQVESDSEMEIPIRIRNDSGSPVNYVTTEGKAGVDLLEFELWRGDVKVKPNHERSRMMPHKENIRTLEPGESLVHRYRLKSDYSSLKAGDHSLRVSYSVNSGSVYDTAYGLTPFKFATTIYIRIR